MYLFLGQILHVSLVVFHKFLSQLCALLFTVAYVFQMTASPRHSSMERRAMVPGELFMQKLDEVSKSVKVRTISFLFIALRKGL